MKNNKYSCIHCGKPVDSSYRRYSATVLKLTNCDQCLNIADKYVEYDVVIIMIDLVLLQQTAYRHVLFNVEFKNFWKLSVILLIMETYSLYSQQALGEQFSAKSDHKPILRQVDFSEDDLLFYKVCVITAMRLAIFIFMIYLSTIIHKKFTDRSQDISFVFVWKTVTLSSFGLFLHLPSLIWDVHKQDIHLFVVSMYVSLSQLLAYTAVCSCGKLWSVFVIFFSSYLKSMTFQLFNIICCEMFQHPINYFLE